MPIPFILKDWKYTCLLKNKKPDEQNLYHQVFY